VTLRRRKEGDGGRRGRAKAEKGFSKKSELSEANEKLETDSAHQSCYNSWLCRRSTAAVLSPLLAWTEERERERERERKSFAFVTSTSLPQL
jgi:hypothetical protein